MGGTTVINFQLLCLVAFLVIVFVIVRYTTEDAVTEPSSLYFCAFYMSGPPRFLWAPGWPEAVAEAMVGGRDLVGISMVRNSTDLGSIMRERRGQDR
jgi:hypothetical protein